MSRVDFLSRRGGWSGSGQFCSTRPMPSRTSSCTRSCHASLGVQAGWWSRSCSTTAGGGWNLQWQNIALAWLYSRTFFSQVNIRNIRETLKTNGNIHRLTTTSREKLKKLLEQNWVFKPDYTMAMCSFYVPVRIQTSTKHHIVFTWGQTNTMRDWTTYMGTLISTWDFPFAHITKWTTEINNKHRISKLLNRYLMPWVSWRSLLQEKKHWQSYQINR